MTPTIKQPSAWIPIALSLCVLAAMILTIAVSGPPTPQPDEGIAAHLFQIWLVLEVVMIGFFALKWLPQRPLQALVVLALQILAVLAACFPVFYFKL